MEPISTGRAGGRARCASRARPAGRAGCEDGGQAVDGAHGGATAGRPLGCSVGRLVPLGAWPPGLAARARRVAGYPALPALALACRRAYARHGAQGDRRRVPPQPRRCLHRRRPWLWLRLGLPRARARGRATLRERDVKASPEAAAPSRATGAHSVRGRAASRSPRQQSVLTVVCPLRSSMCVSLSRPNSLSCGSIVCVCAGCEVMELP